MSGHRCLVVGVCGPDGSGKSTLARQLARRLEARGFTVATAYCFGCVVCRRAHAGRARPRAPGPRAWSWVRRAHAVVDAAELAARLAWACLTARRQAHGRPPAVVTDRGPLDGLAKFSPPPCSLAAALFTWLGRRYHLMLLLDAPPQVLAARDREHSPGELAVWRRAYRGWAGRLPSSARLDTGDRPPATVAAQAAELAIGSWPGNHRGLRGPAAAAGGRRQHVVISSFDSPGDPRYGGGGAAVVEMLAHWLVRQFQVTVVTAARQGRTSMRDGVCYRHLPVGWAGPRASQLLFHALLPVTARRIPHDLWIESFTPPFSTSFLPLFTQARVVGLAQNLSGDEMTRRYRIPFFLIERFGLRFYHDVVVLNPADRARVRRYSPAATVLVIPNCIAPQPLAGQQPGRAAHILFLGRVGVWEKGLDLLLAAYQRSGAATPLLLAGSGTAAEERKLTGLLAATGPGIRWLGHVTGQHKHELLERCAFLELPSRHEAFGISALEAMSYGKPVVHFDLPSLRWMDGDVRVPPFDVSALARELDGLAGDEPRRRELGRAARAAAARYGPEQTAERYLALVRRLVPADRAGQRPGTGAPCR
jgi:glycosyltransferase involved in cell wall biosynthesis